MLQQALSSAFFASRSLRAPTLQLRHELARVAAFKQLEPRLGHILKLGVHDRLVLVANRELPLLRRGGQFHDGFLGLACCQKVGQDESL